ncbi:MAG TPA: hypothetical protein VLW65_05315 [Bryobacteraceae bacterium]|nr:hypothetical protein [Bryobacteraceae bacterium]
MRRRNVLPTGLILLAGGISWAFQDSPIIVGDSSSIHFTRATASDRFQTEAAGLFVHEPNRTVRSITIAGSGTVALAAGWRVDMHESAVVAHMFSSGPMDTIHIDVHGHGLNLPSANHGVVSNVHLRSIAVTARGGAAAQTFSCPAGAECFRIHYQ